MTDRTTDQHPEAPIEPEVTLGGFERIDMPIDWLGEDWALALSNAELGVVFRLYAASLRQSPAGSLPGEVASVAVLMTGQIEPDVLSSALQLWPVHSDGRRYWARVVPLIEEAWGRRRGKKSKDAIRKRRERLRDQLVRCGCTPEGAANVDVQAMVMAELPADARLTLQNVQNAAMQAGVIGPIRAFRPDKDGQFPDSPKASDGQLRDSPGTVRGQLSDSPQVSHARGPTTSGRGQSR